MFHWADIKKRTINQWNVVRNYTAIKQSWNVEQSSDYRSSINHIPANDTHLSLPAETSLHVYPARVRDITHTYKTLQREIKENRSLLKLLIFS